MSAQKIILTEHATKKPLMPKRVLLREAKAAIAAHTGTGGFTIRWVAAHSAFVVVMPHSDRTSDCPFTACCCSAAEMVKLELYISAATAPIIGALQRTAEKGGAK